MAEEVDFVVRDDGFGEIDDDVAGVGPGEEDGGFGAAHGADGAFEETDAHVAATGVRGELGAVDAFGLGGGFGEAGDLRCFGGGVGVLAHEAAPVGEFLLRGGDFDGERELAVLRLRMAGGEHWVGWGSGAVELGDVAEGEGAEALVFEVLHVAFEGYGGRVDPGVDDVGDAVELEDDELALFGVGDYLFEVVEGPVGVGVAGGGD